ncbi:MAG: polysaccharide pyruvyl transferase CsaB [Caldisericota bacterium]|nr:polysaccharide pyruvyl transferase CsaB [Caldisericota bacterium]
MKILLTGYFGFGNAGDEMIFHVMKTKFENKGHCVYSFIKNPKNMNEFRRNSIKAIYSAIKKSDIVVSGGGGILQDKTSSKSLHYYLFIIKVAKLLHKKVAVFAQGIGPLNKQINKIAVKKALNRADLITVRDIHSQNILRDIGVTKKINLTSDLGFRYKEQRSIPLPFDCFIVYAIGKARKMPPLIVLADVGSYIKKSTGLPIIILPFYPERDGEVAKNLSAILESPLIIPEYIEQYPYIIEKSEFVVGMRYHAILLSALKEKAFVGLSYDPKVRSLMKELEIDGIESYENLSINDFKNVFNKNFAERETIQKKLKTKLTTLKERAEENFDLFSKTFDK